MDFIQSFHTHLYPGEQFGIVKRQNPLTIDKVTALAYQQKMVSTQYHEKESMDLVKTSYIK